MRDKFGIFGTVTRFRELSLLLVMMLRIPNKNEFMYKFAKRLALDARELGDRSRVSVVLRFYLFANVSYWLGRVVVRDSDNFVDSYIVHPPLIGQAELVLWSKSCDVLIYFSNVP